MIINQNKRNDTLCLLPGLLSLKEEDLSSDGYLLDKLHGLFFLKEEELSSGPYLNKLPGLFSLKKEELSSGP